MGALPRQRRRAREGRKRRSRQCVALQWAACAAEQAKGSTERAAAAATGVRPSTQRYWAERYARIDASDQEKTFFERPAGAAFLQRLLLALHLVIVFHVGGGIRQLMAIVDLVGLSAFIATSVGCHHRIAHQMEEQLTAFGQQERTRLGKLMAPKHIAVCQDETFHPETCLVAIEPVSNFVLAETYVEHRDAQTWNATMKQALDGLPVQVRQSTSDAAKGIVRYARACNAHHASDLFHIQHETSKAMSLALAHRVNAAKEAVDVADMHIAQLKQQRLEWETTPRPPGRPPNFDRCEAALVAAHLALDTAYQ